MSDAWFRQQCSTLEGCRAFVREVIVGSGFQFRPETEREVGHALYAVRRRRLSTIQLILRDTLEDYRAP